MKKTIILLLIIIVCCSCGRVSDDLRDLKVNEEKINQNMKDMILQWNDMLEKDTKGSDLKKSPVIYSEIFTKLPGPHSYTNILIPELIPIEKRNMPENLNADRYPAIYNYNFRSNFKPIPTRY